MKTPEFDTPKQAGGVEAIGSPNNDLAIVARSRVAWPAWSLIIFCTLLMLALAVWIVSLTWEAIFAFGDRELEAAISNASLCLMMFLYVGVILLGAVRMRQLRQYPLAVTAAVMAIVFVPLLGGLLGVWALVVLLKWDVRRQFPRRRKIGPPLVDPSRRDRLGDYDDDLGDTAAVLRTRLRLPATLMMGGASICLFLCLVLTAWGVAMLFCDTLLPMSGTEEGKENGIVMLAMGVPGAALMTVIVLGAASMRQFRRYQLARTAAILGAVSFVPVLYLSVLVLPFAVWALLVMRNPAVKEEFRQSKISVSDNDA